MAYSVPQLLWPCLAQARTHAGRPALTYSIASSVTRVFVPVWPRGTLTGPTCAGLASCLCFPLGSDETAASAPAWHRGLLDPVMLLVAAAGVSPVGSASTLWHGLGGSCAQQRCSWQLLSFIWVMFCPCLAQGGAGPWMCQLLVFSRMASIENAALPLGPLR